MPRRMSRPGAVLAMSSIAVAALLGLSACGGGSDSSQRQETIDSLMQDMVAGGGITEEQQACVRQGLEGYSDEELTTLKTGESESDVPVELQEKVVSMMTTCLLGE